MTPSFLPSHYIARTRFGPLVPYIEPYLTLVLKAGYKPTTIRGQLRLIARLNRWLRRRHQELRDLNEAMLEQFVQCQRKKWRTPARGVRVTLQRLLGVLREAGVVAPAERASVPPTAAQQLTESYRRYLLEDRGLAESTVDNYSWHVQSFLRQQFGESAVDPASLQAQAVTTFIRQTARAHSSRHAQLLVAALRSFFRFLHYQGQLKADLTPALPKVANWPLASLPKSIAPEAVQRVLDRCDQQTAVGRRDYAVLLLLARLGLRGGEVLRLTLEDLDWRNACISIRARKGPGRTRLPLPAEVGEALAQYLRQDRPRCDCRRVFLRARAPYLALSHTAVISSLVRRALKKAGIESARRGAHLFRHSLATDLLRRGASLQQIGELLRHQSPNSTAIYAKVELNALRPLAQPWPGGAQ